MTGSSDGGGSLPWAVIGQLQVNAKRVSIKYIKVWVKNRNSPASLPSEHARKGNENKIEAVNNVSSEAASLTIGLRFKVNNVANEEESTSGNTDESTEQSQIKPDSSEEDVKLQAVNNQQWSLLSTTNDKWRFIRYIIPFYAGEVQVNADRVGVNELNVRVKCQIHPAALPPDQNETVIEHSSETTSLASGLTFKDDNVPNEEKSTSGNTEEITEQSQIKPESSEEDVNLQAVNNQRLQVNTEQVGVSDLNVQVENQNLFASFPREKAGTVMKVDENNRLKQVEIVNNLISQTVSLPRGLILKDFNQIEITEQLGAGDTSSVVGILGKGNSAGWIKKLKDKKSGQEIALKTVIKAQFHSNEVTLLMALGDLGMAPKLYHFELDGTKVHFTMEVISGKDLKDVIAAIWVKGDTNLAREFALWFLLEFLKIWEEMRSRYFAHGDMHSNNVRLDSTMILKLIDFGSAINLRQNGPMPAPWVITNDIIAIIRLFCSLYSGFDFNSLYHAKEALQTNNLTIIGSSVTTLKENETELYHIMTMLYDTVRDGKERNESLGDTRGVTEYVKYLLSTEEMTEIKKKAARIIFS